MDLSQNTPYGTAVGKRASAASKAYYEQSSQNFDRALERDSSHQQLSVADQLNEIDEMPDISGRDVRVNASAIGGFGDHATNHMSGNLDIFKPKSHLSNTMQAPSGMGAGGKQRNTTYQALGTDGNK